ncbi:MAG: long-chain fatty acid--CoA ligase [Candidatus Promineifilaceae bacterium]
MTDKPWLKYYDAGVPQTLHPYPDKTLFDVVADNASQRPNHPATYFKGAWMTWADLDRLSDIFAMALVDQGFEKGERLAILMPNCPQFLICELGAWKAGAIVSPLNPRYTEAELEHCLTETGATTAVVLTLFYDKFKAIQSKTSIDTVIVTNIKEYLPPFSRFLFTLFKERREGHSIQLQPGDLWLSDLLERYKSARQGKPIRPDVPIDPDDPALLIFTGGTTGRAKAALSSHRALLASGMQIHSWIGHMKDDWNDVTVMLMPMFHAFGNVGVLPVALVGKHLMALVPNPRDLDDLIDTIHDVKPAYLSGVPTLFIALLKHPAVKAGKVDFSSIKLCISGAAPLMLETKNRFEVLTNGRIVEAYALTESVLASVVTPVNGEYKPGAIGIPLPDVDVRIVDAELGTDTLGAGEVGEIIISAPQIMLRYWERPEATAETVRDGWLFTGDLGYLDEDGYLYLVDRKKDLIKPSGFQVWPREVEEVIATHPAVAEVGVAGVPDPYQGEAVKAWVVLNDGSQLTVDELRAFCKEELAAYKVPRRIEFRDSLPKSAVGKVLRKDLVAEESAL